MSKNENRAELGIAGQKARDNLSRRGFLQGAGAAGVALGGGGFAAVEGRDDSSRPAPGQPFRRGKTLRVKPAILALALHDTLPKPNSMPKSWRAYGGIQTTADLQKEVRRLDTDMKELTAKSDFPVEFLPMATVHNHAEAEQVAAGDQDAVLIFGASGYDGNRLSSVMASKSPGIFFVQHRTEPHYAMHTTIGRYILRHDHSTISCRTAPCRWLTSTNCRRREEAPSESDTSSRERRCRKLLVYFVPLAISAKNKLYRTGLIPNRGSYAST